ncbi:cytidine deaminase family protein [Plantactinospora sp. GCM10030261]|uniref:cytidine deaminase family protein n=1 Tax=Plantactinospora sp. GCM10030261 TaxID=3273420 RepID=UPI00360ADEA2
MEPTERALVQAAGAVARLRCRGAAHTVAAAVLGPDGRVFTGVNLRYPVGETCAEVVALGAAATQGVRDPVAIVAVGDGGRTVFPPCGRCRAVLREHAPSITVIIGPLDALRALPLTDLPPEPPA